MNERTYLRSKAARRAAQAAIISSFFVSACDKGGAGAASPDEAGGLVGSAAPDFDLPAQAGESRATLAAAKGKVVLVDFWATWCAPCKASFPKYEALAKKHAGELVVIGISEDDEADGIKGFAKETGATFTLAWDASKGVAGSYHPGSMPTSFIVDKNGLVRFTHAGYRDGDEKTIESEITSLAE
jgi:peroxiredoxin